MTRHVMIDLETLGAKRKDVAIVQLAAVAFDPETGEITSSFNRYVKSVGSDCFYIDPQTVAWWLTQKRAAALGERLQSADAVYLPEALIAFAEWYALQNAEAVWSHGCAFDVAIVEHACAIFGYSTPWHYRHPRDTRTLYALAPGGMPVVKTDPEREHDALYDCELQVQHVVGALKALRGQASAAALAGTLCVEEAKRRADEVADTERGEA